MSREPRIPRLPVFGPVDWPALGCRASAAATHEEERAAAQDHHRRDDGDDYDDDAGAAAAVVLGRRDVAYAIRASLGAGRTARAGTGADRHRVHNRVLFQLSLGVRVVLIGIARVAYGVVVAVT